MAKCIAEILSQQDSFIFCLLRTKLSNKIPNGLPLTGFLNKNRIYKSSN